MTQEKTKKRGLKCLLVAIRGPFREGKKREVGVKLRRRNRYRSSLARMTILSDSLSTILNAINYQRQH